MNYVSLLFCLSWQTVIQENPFTDLPGPRGSESPTLSIGEALGTTQHNPFKATEDVDSVPPTMWDLEKQQLVAQMTLLQEQLRAETSARIESQVSDIVIVNQINWPPQSISVGYVYFALWHGSCSFHNIVAMLTADYRMVHVCT